MAKVGFLGLGRMGRPMASRLVEAGHDVAVWNRSPERSEALRSLGARVAATPGEAARGARFVVTMLSDEDAIAQVLFSQDGAATGMGPGSTMIEMSTVGPSAISRLRERLPDEIALVDAPVLGSVPQAERGELQIFAGGTRESFDRCREVLAAMGKPFLVGELGAGAALKLVVNSTLGAAMVVVGEALALARALGVDESIALRALEDTYVGGVVQRKRDAIVGGDYTPRFTLELAAKDQRLVTQEADRAGARLEAAHANLRVIEEAVAAGYGDLDYSAVIRYLRERAT
jgi:3-hydroxyisobutyrate dehydrogenase-like beta-hydroxyacid dehydrogenase